MGGSITDDRIPRLERYFARLKVIVVEPAHLVRPDTIISFFSRPVYIFFSTTKAVGFSIYRVLSAKLRK